MITQAKKVYIISGPAGVGKSTTAKELVNKFESSAYISGDDISHMHINGRRNPWESEQEVALIWDNLLSLTKNFIHYGNDVVIDYVTFPKEAYWLTQHLTELNVKVIYVVLWADSDILLARDNLREPSHRMGERCLVLVDEFTQANLDEKHILNTSHFSIQQMPNILDDIINNPKFILV